MRQLVDGKVLREIMRRVPSPVTVVTATDGSEARGMTAGSFTSVSLLPPLISFNVARDSRMHDVIAAADYYAVHILAEDQAEVSRIFSLPDQDAQEQLGKVDYVSDERGLPIIQDVVGVLVCTPYARYDAGDHSIFVGEVIEARNERPGQPLIYLDRNYHGIGETASPSVDL